MIVYLITNIISGKRYVGQTKDLSKRWRDHCRARSKGVLSKAIKKYGAADFIIEPIIEVSTREEANEFEKEYIERYLTRVPNGYNLTDGGEGVVNPTPEIRQKMSQGAKNQKTEDKVRGGHTQGLIQGPKNVESGLWNRVVSLGGIASGKSKSLKKQIANENNGIRFGEWSVKSGHLASLRTAEHQSKAGKCGGLKGGPAANHLRWHVKRDIVNPNCSLCLEKGQNNDDGI